MIHMLLEISGEYLIEFMALVLGSCLFLRWIAFISSKKNDAYFSALTREITLNIEKDKEEGLKINDTESYLGDFFVRLSDKLPNRSLRFKKEEKNASGKKIVSMEGYISGRENFLHILKAESGVFHCQTPPNFNELTYRILSQDPSWSNMLLKLPLEGVSRLIDIMPGLFVVFGVFGTFVGISLALPEISKIDFNNLDGSGETLSNFVLNTAYAMETSLAGIVFSVLMTIMNAIYPIKDVRGRIHKKVETSLQTLWYHVQLSSKNEAQLTTVIQELTRVLKDIKMNHFDHDKDQVSPIIEIKRKG